MIDKIKSFFKKLFSKDGVNTIKEVCMTDEEFQAKKKRYQYIKGEIDKQIERKDDYLLKTAESRFEQEKKEVEEYNSTCPLCKSKEVVNKINRTQGQIKGTSTLHGSYSAYYGSGNIDGNLDTNEVKHCNECGNEWKPKKEPKMYSNWDTINVMTYHLVDSILEIAMATYDNRSIKEPYNSLEEKKEGLFEKIKNDRKNIIDFLSNCNLSIETILRMAIADHGSWFDDGAFEPHLKINEKLGDYYFENKDISDFEYSKEIETYFNRLGFYKIDYNGDKKEK